MSWSEGKEYMMFEETPIWTLSAEETESLPLPELGKRMLLVMWKEGVLVRPNWFLKTQAAYRGHSAALNAMAEAWDWLHAQGYIAETPNTAGRRGEVIVTRKGYELLNED